MKSVTFVERRVPRGGHNLYIRDYPGAGPAFVLLHGFPDNLQIYDGLASILAAQGHRVVALDFLGYGQSDKPSNYSYSGAEIRLPEMLDPELVKRYAKTGTGEKFLVKMGG